MSKDILSVENITMQFGGVVAVNNLSLHIPEGQIVALIGPNGAGKTTAFNCITGVYEPTNGLVKFLDEPMVRNHPTGKMKKLYKGENPLLYTAEYHPEDETKEQMLARDPLAGTGKIVSPTPDRITKLGIARTFQNIRLFDNMTVEENVRIGLHNQIKYGMFSGIFRLPQYWQGEKKQHEKALDLLSIFGMENMGDVKAGSLPYGAQRRLEIVRALATNPSLLLLDEPAAGMNPHETAELMENIIKIRDQFQIAILLIEHDMNLVMGICEGICVLNYGRIIAKGTAEEIQNNPVVIEAYLGKQKEAKA